METVFFDYYHPYAGLCNQLYLITNHIAEAFVQGKQIYIHKFNIDIFKKERVPFSEVIDIKKTNENFIKFGCRPLLSETPPKIIGEIPELCIYPVSSIEILSCLEFNENIVKNVKTIEHYGMHFRLDIDAIVHYLFETDVYNHFMGLEEKNEFIIKMISLPKVSKYIKYIMDQYIKFIYQIGFDKPWYICTSIGKENIHNVLLPFLYKITDIIRSNGGKLIDFEKNYPQRELNALVELLTLRDSDAIVGFEGSSFSEGYCYKVNSIRNPGKRYLFVNGIVPKIKWNFQI